MKASSQPYHKSQNTNCNHLFENSSSLNANRINNIRSAFRSADAAANLICFKLLGNERHAIHVARLCYRDLNQLEWLLINANELTSLDGELPSSGHNLKMLYAVDNKLTHLPAEFRYLHRLETLFLQHNKIRNLDGTLQKARRLKFLELSYNDLQEVIFRITD